MSKIVFIFCEDILQQRILEKITTELTADVVIRFIQTGGKGGQKAFVNGFLARGGAASADHVFIFRDRDFDYPVSDLPELKIDGKLAVSHKTTIENYLLDIVSFQNYCNRVHPATQIDTAEVFLEAAKSIAAYSAVRHTLGFFRNNYSFDTTWTAGSGHLPLDLSTQFCQTNAWTLIAEKQEKLCPISREDFDARFQIFLGKFNEHFFISQQHLVWFNGKDLQKAISKKLPFRFNFKHYETELLKSFDFHAHPDLEQLFQVLNAL